MNTEYAQIINKGSTASGILRLPYALFRPVYEKTSFHRSVIEELPSEHLKNAYAHCRAITRHFAKTFYLATRFLPNNKQRSIFAIYALCRYMDDLVDETQDLIDQKKIDPAKLETIIEQWKQKLQIAYDTGEADNPILVAFANTLETFHIPQKYPMELLEGVCMDLTKNRYETFEELYDYSYKVASVVGLMTSEVFGYSEKKAIPHAIDLGIAMQLTNILRDIGEDLSRNRIYIPREDLVKFEISEEDLFSRKLTDNFIALMDFQIQRARTYYESADEGISMLSADSRLPVSLARQNYSRILDRIERNKYQVFSKRAYLSTSEKLAILPKAWISTML